VSIGIGVAPFMRRRDSALCFTVSLLQDLGEWIAAATIARKPPRHAPSIRDRLESGRNGAWRLADHHHRRRLRAVAVLRRHGAARALNPDIEIVLRMRRD